MKRPALAALIVLAAGIITGRYFYSTIGLLPIFGISAAAAIIPSVKTKNWILVTFPVLFILGWLFVQNSVRDTAPYLTKIAESGLSAHVEGIVTDVSKTSKQRTKIIVKTTKVTAEPNEYTTRVLILAYLDVNQHVEVGARVVLEGRLNTLRFQRNPGGYDEFQYLRSRKIQYTMFPSVYSETRKSFFLLTFLQNISINMRETFDRALPERQARILTAIVLGDKSGLYAETRELFHDAGIYHILAVSGLHVGILAMALNKLLTLARIRKKPAAIITLVFIALYTVMTGAGIGTVRALMMFTAYTAGGLIYKRYDALAACAVSAIVLLLYEPLYLFDMGFQYSYVAVFALIVATKPVEDILLRLPFGGLAGRFIKSGYMRKYFAASLSASIATFPLMAYYYFDVPLIGIVINTLIAPTVVIVTGGGFITGVLGLFSYSVAKAVSVAPYAAIRVYEIISESGVRLPFAKILTGRPGLPLVLAFYGVFLVFVYASGSGDKILKKRKHTLIGAAAGFIIVCAAASLTPDTVRVAFLDVGQGDGIIISKGSHAFAIDGGGTILEKRGDDTGVWTILPYMSLLGVQKLECAFVTHSDTDHALGIIEAIDAGRVKTLYISREAEGERAVYDAMIETALLNKTDIVYIGAGDTFTFWDEVFVECLYPEKGSQNSGNDSSLVLSVTHDGVTFLFTGDIETRAESEMLSSTNRTLLAADILNLAHHGSRTSSSKAFLDAVSPGLAVVSSGYRNIYSHPHTEVTDRLDAMGVPLYNTAVEGAIIITPANGAVKIKTMAGAADERIERKLKIW